MKHRGVMGLVVAIGMLFSGIALGGFPDLGSKITPYDPSKFQVPDFGTLAICSNSPFSQKVEDYAMTARLHPIQKGLYQVAVYGRLLPSVDPEKLKSIATNVADFTKVTDQWTRDFLFGVWTEPFVGALPFLWGRCELLPSKDAATKGPLFRCVHSLPVEGTDLDAYKSDESFDYVLADGKLDAAGALCKRAPAGLKIKAMVGNAGADADGDGVPDSIDNCPQVANFSQDVDASGNPVACPAAATECDTSALCTADVCANNGFAATCDTGTLCTADVCAGLGLSTDAGSGVNADSGGMCSLIPIGAANPAGLILMLSALGLIAARRRG